MKTRVLPLLVLVGLLAPVTGVSAASVPAPKLTRADDRVRVELGGQLFTEYIFKGGPKPYLYPVLTFDGTEMMRHFPMKKDVPGEVRDHPHHRSLWFTHGAVNGIDFWAESELGKPGQTKQGTIVSEGVEHTVKGNVGEIRARNRWVGPDSAVHLTDDTVIKVQQLADGGRYLDYEVTLKAPKDKPVVFGDTKEGSMAIRVPLWMTPEHSYSPEKGKRVKHEGKGTIVNAEGIRNDAAWGKKSTWVDYHGPKDGKTYGIAMFDHPSNPRHPTWWHVRSYALFAANPFGKHDFENLKNEPKAGDLKIEAGKSVTFRWRFYFHLGDEQQGKVAERYKDFAAGK
jgi:hypothetical protein